MQTKDFALQQQQQYDMDNTLQGKIIILFFFFGCYFFIASVVLNNGNLLSEFIWAIEERKTVTPKKEKKSEIRKRNIYIFICSIFAFWRMDIVLFI